MDAPTTRPFAVVTGASSGIGRELAREFAEHGYDLLIAAEDTGITTAAAELSQSGTAVDAVQADLAEALREEVKDSGVTVTALMPGPTKTDFFHRAEMDDTMIGQSSKDDAATVAKQGFEALMAGDAKIVPGGVKSKLQAAANVVLPDAVKAKAHAAQAKPGSGS